MKKIGICLTQTWMGNPTGTKFTMTENDAQILIKRGWAKSCETEEVREQEAKSFRKPAKDKMMKEPQIEKEA